MRYGEAFNQYKEKFYLAEGTMPEEKIKKLFIDYKLLNKVISLFTSYCPDLTAVVGDAIIDDKTGAKKSKAIKTRRDQKVSLVREALTAIGWKSLNQQIYDILESEGDAFFYIYFDEQSKNSKVKIPKLKLLPSKNMKSILLDESSKPKAYIYKDKLYDEEIDYTKGEVKETNEREYILVFEKGQVHMIDNNKTSKGSGLELDGKGKVVVTKSTKNKDSYADMIPIIHVPAKKTQDEKFSIIPAEDYVDLCLQISQIHSDIRAINRNLGFPRTVLLDCEFIAGDGQIGGVRIAQTTKAQGDDSLDSPKQGQIIDLQLKNGQDSNFTELQVAIDNLYDTVGITNPSLMMRVGSSDSSKVMQQVNIRMEQKIEGYVDSIIQAFIPYFKVLLTENNLYDEETDTGFSFTKPKSLIKNSAYDELLISQLALNNGEATLESLLRQKGMTDSAIAKHMEEINEEIRNGTDDISVSKQVERTVKNANNSVDN